ncbi:hypothetical protein F900_01070 [Acinetobacter modestus]|uniref:Uncharacterized protein n=1 Tax=Acinetobacter modestus TaxID=1776740 RepID=N9M2A9_9GAMM|nr:hypothetical protein [Acinetobacter modestus]ENX02624.1 hypothetical protein F900_01070 [Acinetobacter modestus]
MVAPIPKTKAVELLAELSSYERLQVVMSEFNTNKFLRDIKKLFDSKVDIANLWICKGFVYSLSNQPEAMVDAFRNAQKLGATDKYSMFNQATQYILHGYYENAIEALVLSKDDVAQEQLERIAISTFDYDQIEQHDLSVVAKNNLLKRKSRLAELGIDINEAKVLMNAFFQILKSRKCRFGLVHHDTNQDEYYLHFEAVTDIDMTHSVLNEFDIYIAEHPELYKVNSKINIVLTPISSIRHNSVA